MEFQKRGLRTPKPGQSVADTHPHLLSEWDYEKNTVSPTDIGRGSEMPVFFVCPIGHSYSTPLRYRCSERSHGCNVCSGHVIVEGVNDLATLFPTIANQMDKADNDGIKSYQVGAKVSKRFNFMCDKGHVWNSRIDNRTSAGGNCPYCSNQKVLPGYNDLLSQHPNVAQRFDSIRNGVTADQVVSLSNKKYFMLCSVGHSYDVSLQTVVRLGVACSYCCNIKVLTGYNDLATLHPEIATEYDVTRNGGNLPTEVSPRSKKKHWFTCSAKHSWNAVMVNRTYRGDGCPDCSGAQSSAVERAYRKAFADSLALLDVEEARNSTLEVPWRRYKAMRVDIVGKLPSTGTPVVIEYDGEYWHNRPESFARDIEKTKALLEAGHIVVRIRENKLGFLDISHPNLYQLNANFGTYKKDLGTTVQAIEHWLSQFV